MRQQLISKDYDTQSKITQKHTPQLWQQCSNLLHFQVESVHMCSQGEMDADKSEKKPTCPVMLSQYVPAYFDMDTPICCVCTFRATAVC